MRSPGLQTLFVSLLVATSSALADETAPEVHGFVSQGTLITTGNDYLVPGSTEGSFQMTEAGINFTKQLDGNLRVGIQLFAQNFASTNDFDVRADWFYIDYRFRDWLGFRAGRLKIPFALHNEANDIDAARVPILLPQSVYPQQTRSFLFAQTGTEVYGYVPTPHIGALEYRLYLGTIFIDPKLVTPPNSSVDIQFNVPYVVGGQTFWETPLDGLRFGGSLQKLRLDVVAVVGPTTVEIENDSVLWTASTEYAFRDLELSAEYGRWRSIQTDNLGSPKIDVESERAYVMSTYRVAPRVQTGLYYSILYPDVDDRAGPENQQHDIALTVRFDVSPAWLIKLEGHHMTGTASLTNPIVVDPPPPSERETSWAVFLAKTTISF